MFNILKKVLNGTGTVLVLRYWTCICAFFFKNVLSTVTVRYSTVPLTKDHVEYKEYGTCIITKMKWNLKNKDGMVRYGTLPVPYHFLSNSYRIFKKSLPVLQDSKEMVRYRYQYRTVLYIKNYRHWIRFQRSYDNITVLYWSVLVPVPCRYLKDNDYHYHYGTVPVLVPYYTTRFKDGTVPWF